MLHRIILLTTVAAVTTLVLSIIIFPAISRVAGVSSAHGVAREMPVNSLTYGYVKRTFTDGAGRSLVYYLYIPDHYNSQQKYPLVLLLHGDGEKINPKRTPCSKSDDAPQTIVRARLDIDLQCPW